MGMGYSEEQTFNGKKINFIPVNMDDIQNHTRLDNRDTVSLSQSETDFKPPEFTIKELRECIPAHLFQKSLLKSSAYLLCNLGFCAAILYLATLIDVFLPFSLQLIAWPIYWWFEGIAAGGVWVIAHECGHQAFCDSRLINNTIGLILHSCLLVPYHSWRISHAQHHAGTAHIKKDQVFVPYRRRHVENSSILRLALEESPLYTFSILMIFLTVGWPLYLIFNLNSQRHKKFANHFFPSSPIFKPHHRSQIILSNVGVLTMIGILAHWVWTTSFWTMTKYYLIPYLFVNGWLITVTLLQHTDVNVPHYSPDAWNFVRGALSTVDRDYGWFLNHALHHIQDSHVAHHLFSQMPHYNAIQATPYLKEKLGKYYMYDRTPVFIALMRSIRTCVFVENQGDILFYKNKL